MTVTFCTSGSVKLKAGANVSTALTDANYTELINQAECYINGFLKKDYVALYSGLKTDRKKLLEDAASSHAALSAIGYNMGNYTKSEAQKLLDVNYARLTDVLAVLKDYDAQAFLSG